MFYKRQYASKELMSKSEDKQKLIENTDFDNLNKIEVASMFWDSAYQTATKLALEVLENYIGLDNIKEHLKETLEKE